MKNMLRFAFGKLAVTSALLLLCAYIFGKAAHLFHSLIASICSVCLALHHTSAGNLPKSSDCIDFEATG